MSLSEAITKSPSMKPYLVSIVFLILVILQGFTAAFVPWAMKDLAISSRAWAYPFKTCIQDTFSTVHLITCLDNDFFAVGGAPLTQGSICAAWILTTIAFVFISVICGVLLLILMVWMANRILAGQRPVKTAVAVQFGLLFEVITSILAWVFYIIYATALCVPNSIFPVSSYSYGFVLYIFVTFCAIVAFLAGFKGFFQLRNPQLFPDVAKEIDANNLDNPVTNFTAGDQLAYPAYPVVDLDQTPMSTPIYPTH